MAFLSTNDKSFWDNCPESLRHVQEIYRQMRPAPSNIAYFTMGEIKDDPPTIVCLRLAPGEVLSRHRHDCHRFEIIVQGSLYNGERWLKAGDVMTSAPNIPYGPHTAGPEGSTSFEIFSNHRASYSLQLETPQGPVPFDTSTPQGLRQYLETAKRVARGEPV